MDTIEYDLCPSKLSRYICSTKLPRTARTEWPDFANTRRLKSQKADNFGMKCLLDNTIEYSKVNPMWKNRFPTVDYFEKLRGCSFCVQCTTSAFRINHSSQLFGRSRINIHSDIFIPNAHTSVKPTHLSLVVTGIRGRALLIASFPYD